MRPENLRGRLARRRDRQPRWRPAPEGPQQRTGSTATSAWLRPFAALRPARRGPPGSAASPSVKHETHCSRHCPGERHGKTAAGFRRAPARPMHDPARSSSGSTSAAARVACGTGRAHGRRPPLRSRRRAYRNRYRHKRASIARSVACRRAPR